MDFQGMGIELIVDGSLGPLVIGHHQRSRSGRAARNGNIRRFCNSTGYTDG